MVVFKGVFWNNVAWAMTADPHVHEFPSDNFTIHLSEVITTNVNTGLCLCYWESPSVLLKCSSISSSITAFDISCHVIPVEPHYTTFSYCDLSCSNISDCVWLELTLIVWWMFHWALIAVTALICIILYIVSPKCLHFYCCHYSVKWWPIFKKYLAIM